MHFKELTKPIKKHFKELLESQTQLKMRFKELIELSKKHFKKPLEPQV